MLTTPVMTSVFYIDALLQNNLEFSIIGGEKNDGYEYIIYDQQNDITTQNAIKGIQQRINLPKNTLNNNLEYKIKLRTYKKELYNQEDKTVYSDWSNLSLIKTYKTATVTINNVAVVDKQSYTFIGTYSQDVYIPMKSYYYILYDSNNVIIKQYSQIYTLNTTNLSQFMSGFDNGVFYKIKLVCIDQNNRISESPLYTLECKYESPKIKQILTLKPNYCNASVSAESDIRSMRFVSGDDDWDYYNHEYIDLTRNGWIYMAKAFEIEEDFDLQVWYGKLIKNKVFIFLSEQSSNDYLKIWYDDTKKLFICEKIYNNYKMQYRTIETIEIDNGWYSLLIKQLNGRIGIYVERYSDMQDDSFFYVTEGVGKGVQ